MRFAAKMVIMTGGRTFLSRTQLVRCGEADEVANAIAFPTSDQASAITGQCVDPDGGQPGLNYSLSVSNS